MNWVTFTYNADPATLKRQIAQYFVESGYRVHEIGDWSLDVQKGPRFVYGSFIKHIFLDVYFTTAADGSSQLTLQRRHHTGLFSVLFWKNTLDSQSALGDVARDVHARLVSGAMLVGEPTFG